MKKAFLNFGLSLFNLNEELFLNNNDLNVFTFGRSPVCIDILTKVKGLSFDVAFENSFVTEFSGVNVRMIDLNDLISAKKVANRPKDIDDIGHIS